MEAATPLRQPTSASSGDVVAIDGLVVDDECAVRVVREREQNGDDPAKTVRDAVEIGARVLDREQAGANAEFVKTEFEKASSERAAGVHRAGAHGRRVLRRRSRRGVRRARTASSPRSSSSCFADGSAASVQNRVRELVSETLAKSREDLVRQFSSADGATRWPTSRPARSSRSTRPPARSDATQRALLEKMAELEKQLQALRDREGEARGGRGRARARHRQGTHVRGGGGRGGRRDRAARRATSPRRSAT